MIKCSNDLLYWKWANNQDPVDFIEDKSKQYEIIENKKVETSERKSLRNKPRADCNEERMPEKIIAENEASGTWEISLMLAKKFEWDFKDLLPKDLALDGELCTKKKRFIESFEHCKESR